MNDSSEKAFLDKVVDTYVTSTSPQDRWIKTLAIRVASPYIREDSTVLEYGCCDGFMTSLIEKRSTNLTVVDGSATFITMARQKVPENVKFVHALFEEYQPSQRYDFIFATYVLEHVADAIAFLKAARTLLNPSGRLFVVVPNARALSRQLARHMGLIDDLFGLTQNDKNHGHRRVYDRQTLSKDLSAAGLQEIAQGGLMLKPLADFQMDQMFAANIIGDQQVEGMYKLGLEYPDLAGSLFSVCQIA